MRRTPASEVVLDAVAAALTHAYWFKEDLKSFLTRVGVPGTLVATLPWDERKRDVARTLVDRLSFGDLILQAPRQIGEYVTPE